jgi:hypothetical protein
LFIAALLAAGIYAQTNENNEQGNRITAITITGLVRTKPHVIERPLQRFIGVDADILNTADIHAIIMDTGILESISIEVVDNPDGNGKILKVIVEEKWAFFPIPLLSIDSDGSSFGGIIMDANAFGLNDKMLVAGVYSSDGWMTSVMYINTPDKAGILGWNIGTFYVTQEREDSDRFKTIYRRFNVNSVGVSIGFSYPITEIISMELSLMYQNKTLQEIDAPLEAPSHGAQVINIRPALSARNTEWDGFFLSEQSVSLRFDYAFGIDITSFLEVSLRGAYSKSLFPGFRLNFDARIIYSPFAPVLFESSPSSSGVAILPKKFSAKNYAGASLGFEKYLFKFSFGTLSFLAAYQIVWSEGEVLALQFDHGATSAIQLYLSKIAIPAVGLGASYNATSNIFQMYFSMGVSL